MEYNLSPVAKIVPQIERDCKLVFDWNNLEARKSHIFYFLFETDANIILNDVFLFSPNKEVLKALETERPSVFFRTLVACDCLSVVFPEINALRGQTQPIEHHPEGDAFQHTMDVLDRASSLTTDVKVRFAALCHDIGKGVTPKEMLPKHHGHDAKGAEIVAAFANGRFLAAHKDAAEVASRFHMKARTEMGAKPMLAMLESVNKSKLGLDGLRIVVAADSPKDDVASLPCFNEAVIHAALDRVVVPAEMRGKSGEAIRQFVHKTKLARVRMALDSLS